MVRLPRRTEAVIGPESPPIEGSQPGDESVVGAYFSHWTELLNSGTNPREIVHGFVWQFGAQRFMSVLEMMGEMDRLYREMRSVLNEFTGRGYFLVNILTIEHLATAMKLYVISWHTMQDLLARLVNAVLDLGIADRDITIYLVLNNDHVRATRIPEIISAYEKAAVIQDLRKRRNDAVHRGRIPDLEVEKLLKERNSLDSRRYLPLTLNSISEEEYRTSTSELQARLSVLAKEKQDLWSQLHQQTVAMTSAVAGELAIRMIERHKKETIEHQTGAGRLDAGRLA
jgi:hypothetical protein